MTHLPGNPHSKPYSEDLDPSLFLAIAWEIRQLTEEQRTANLLEAFRAVAIPEHNLNDDKFRETILRRLGLTQTTFTTAQDLATAPEKTVVEDRLGDIGIIQAGHIHYPESAPVAFSFAANHWAPFHVLHTTRQEGNN